MQDDYRINLEIFEGPLDLLLHLVRRNDVEIHDIPIALILDNYFGYLELMQQLDIDVAGEFILMASELTHIKSRLLLCKDEVAEADEPDPRADLIAKLLEYQKYKNAGQWLLGQKLLNRDVFKRPVVKPEFEDSNEVLIDVEPFHLIQIFQNVLKKAPKETVHEVEAERISITDRIYQILDLLGQHESMGFEELFAGAMTRSNLVVTFMACLEMARLSIIRIYQSELLNTIRVKRIMNIAGVQAMEEEKWKDLN